MKKILFLVLLSIHFVAYAQEDDEWSDPTPQATIDGLLYKLSFEDHTAMVANVNFWEGELTIPEQVVYEGESYTVDRIEWVAFAGCTTLTKVMIPKTVTEIRHYARWEDCKNPFVGCTSLESIEVDEGNPSMCSVDGVLFSKDSTHLYSYPVGAKATSYKVPDGVTWIGIGAFQNSAYLESVEMPNSVLYISGSVFNGCVNLKSVKLSENIKIISAYLFSGCESLRVIDIPQSVSEFAESVFRWTHLKDLVIRGTFSENLRKDTFYSVDASMIIYAQRSEVPKFKKVFSGTVLPLEYYTAGLLDSQVEDSKSTSNLFDLQGRRIQGEPKHGVYIRNGKKVMK